MAAIVWDEATARTYESGVDRGVLYLPAGGAVPWNGLTAVEEKFDQERKPIYWDGKKINDLVVLGDYEATLKAVTYPNEFSALEGYDQPSSGLYLGNQKPILFGLSYRTLKGNSLDPDLGYRIHIIYNVTAIPTDKAFSTITDSFSLTEFEWDISTIPEEVTGFRPTAHVIIDSTNSDIATIEELLYGTEAADPELPLIADLFA